MVETPVEPGEEMRGVRLASMNTLINQASAVVPTTQETLNEIRKSLQRFERLAPATEDALREYTRLAQETQKLLPDVRKTNDQLRSTASEAEVTARVYSRLGERLDVLLQTNQEKLIRTLDQLNDTLGRVAWRLLELSERFGTEFRIGRYDDFQPAAEGLPELEGELVGSRLQNLLRGVNSARIYLKQANDLAERRYSLER